MQNCNQQRTQNLWSQVHLLCVFYMFLSLRSSSGIPLEYYTKVLKNFHILLHLKERFWDLPVVSEWYFWKTAEITETRKWRWKSVRDPRISVPSWSHDLQNWSARWQSITEFQLHTSTTSNLTQAVTLLACPGGVSRLDLSRDTDYPHWDFPWLSSVPPG